MLLSDYGKINFWRTKTGTEVDFIADFKGKGIPIEVKYSPFEKPQISRSFGSFIKSFKPKRS